MLYKTHQNELFRLLQEAGLNPVLFEVHSSGIYWLLQTRSADFRFSIEQGGSATPYRIATVPGIGKTIRQTRRSAKSWVEIKESFAKWLIIIKEESTAPDLWAEAAKTAQLFAPSATPSDDKFTRAELAEVQGQLRQLQQSFTTAALPEAARQKLIELTQTAAVKAEGLTKKDWQNWLIGGFISAITALSLNPTQAADVLKLVKAAFGGLFLH